MSELTVSQFSHAQRATALVINQAIAAKFGSFAGVAATVNAFAEDSLRMPSPPGDEGKSFGPWQIQARDAILAATGIDIQTADLFGQCDALIWLLQNKEKPALAQITAAKSYEDATRAWTQFFERPGAPGQPDKRVADVPVFLQILGLSE